MMVIEGRSCLVGARYTLAMPCRVAGSQNEQGNDSFGWSLGIATTLGSDVTSCSIENPSITPFFLVAYLR
jgi:hypothetical protein